MSRISIGKAYWSKLWGRSTKRPGRPDSEQPRRRLRLSVEGLEERAVPALSVPINYNLAAAGKVSLAVYNGGGQLVRTLLAGQQQAAGAQSIVWDGRDDDGNTVPSGNYSWKLLRPGSGLQAEYQLTVGSSFPYGSQYWESSLGNQNGPSSVAVSGGYLYAAAGQIENVASHTKIRLSDNTRVWSGGPPDIRDGYWARDVIGDTIYGLQNSNGIVSGIDVNAPNGLNDQVNPRISVLNPGDSTPTSGDYDMAAANTGTVGPQMVISYSAYNKIRWFDPTYDNTIGTYRGYTGIEAMVSNPRGVAIDNSGNVLVISGTSVVRVSKNNPAVQTTVITGLVDPFRLAVDRLNGNVVFVYDRGTGQVKKYSYSATSATAVTAPTATFGRSGGMAYGLYVPTDFGKVQDIASDEAGGFVVAEPLAPVRRVARFNGSGQLLREWQGGTPWVPSVAVDPTNKGVIWYDSANGGATGDGIVIARATLDLTTKTWSTHSLYNIKSLWGGTLSQASSIEATLNVLTRNGTKYLVRDNAGEIFKIDETNWRLIPVVKINLIDGTIWTDGNGNGLQESTEWRTFPGYYPQGSNFVNLDSDEDFNFYFYETNTRTTKNQLYKIEVTGWNSVGAPVYESLSLPNLQFASPAAVDEFKYGIPAFQGGYVARGAGASPLYSAINFGYYGGQTYGQSAASRVLKYDSNGNFLWKVTVPRGSSYSMYTNPPPGKLGNAFKQVFSVNGLVVATDNNGGWDGQLSHAITYAWDADGLWVGGLFDNKNLSVAPASRYYLSTDNGVGDFFVDANGDVYFYGASENEIRVYKITGWTGWERQNGALTVAADTVPVQNIWGALNGVSKPGGVPQELGTVFTPTTSGTVTHLRVYSTYGDSGAHSARLWRNTDGAKLYEGTWTYGGTPGWVTLDIPDIQLSAGVAYTVSVSTGADVEKWYPFTYVDSPVYAGDNRRNLTYPYRPGVTSSTLGVRPTTQSAETFFRDVVFVPSSTSPPPAVGAGTTVFTTQSPTATFNDKDYELGMRFQTSQTGQITKIRFYKATGETGVHTGRIWDANGNLLVSVRFTSETASGWQTVSLPNPLTVLPNTTYTVSVNANAAYVTTSGYPWPATNGALSGTGGVYNDPLGSYPTIPGANYFRDVEFVPALVNETFDGGTVGSPPVGWTVASPAGTSVTVQAFPSMSDKSLRFTDTSTTAEGSASKSIGAQSGVVSVEWKVYTDRLTKVTLFSGGAEAVYIQFNTGQIQYKNSSQQVVNILPFTSNSWYTLKLVANVSTDKFDLYVNGVLRLNQLAFTNAVGTISSFQIGSGISAGGSGALYVNDVRITYGQALTASAARPANASRSTPKLTEAQAQSLVPAAVGRWAELRVDPSALNGVTVVVTDLGGSLLGTTVGTTIYIDDDAAGYGWFVDPTPNDDGEYDRRGRKGPKGYDLLTVLAHELGHILGLGDETDADGSLMDSVLRPRTRRLPGVADVHELEDFFPPRVG